MIEAKDQATGDLSNQSQCEVELQGRIIDFVTDNMKNVKQGKGSTVIIDISQATTDKSLNEFIDSVELNTDPFSLNIRKLLARFFLGVGIGLYENRKYILDELGKRQNGDELFEILMQRLGAFERTRNEVLDHPNLNPVPYQGYPKTIERARSYFLLH